MGVLLVVAGDALLATTVQKVVAAVFVIILGIPICHRGGTIIGRKDPGEIVWDEIAAIPIVFAINPIDPFTLVIGWAWFRLFDIWKPWPIRQLQDIPGGVGVMIDDLLAGVLAAVCLYGTIHARSLVG